MKNHYFSPLRIVLSVLTVFLAAIVYSCTPPPSEDPVLTIEPSVTSIVFSADGKTAAANGQEISAAFGVTTNQEEWSVDISEKNSWLSVDKTDNTFTLSAEANKEFDDRGPITVTVKAGKAAPVVINVKQAGAQLPADELYFAGVFEFIDGSSVSEAYAYLKDGKLEVIGSDREMTVNAMTVWNGDIYMCGASLDGDKANPVYWKNNEKIVLSHSGNLVMAFDIAVSGGDVYVVGADFDQVTGRFDYVCWKNGEKLYVFSRDSEYDYEIGHIAVSGSDIYVAGRESRLVNGEPTVSLAYWKNGEIFRVREVINYYSYVYGMTVKDNDVYIAASLHDGMNSSWGYFKNSDFVKLNDGLTEYLVGIDVSDGNVYLAGNTRDPYNNSVGVIYKNGNPTYFYPRDLENIIATATFDIAISNGVVYVSGYEHLTGEEGSSGVIIPGYWVGASTFVPITVPGGSFYPNFIAVEAK